MPSRKTAFILLNMIVVDKNWSGEDESAMVEQSQTSALVERGRRYHETTLNLFSNRFQSVSIGAVLGFSY